MCSEYATRCTIFAELLRCVTLIQIPFFSYHQELQPLQVIYVLPYTANGEYLQLSSSLYIPYLSPFSFVYIFLRSNIRHQILQFMGTNNLMFEVFFRFLPDLISRLPLSSELTVDSWCFKMKLYFISYLLFISNLFQEMSTIAILKQVWYALVLLCCVNVLG